MEEAVNNRKTVKDYRVKGCPFHSKPSTLFREQDNRHLLNIPNDRSVPNVMSQRMHGIHFLTTKRLVRKRFVS